MNYKKQQRDKQTALLIIQLNSNVNELQWMKGNNISGILVMNLERRIDMVTFSISQRFN